MYTAARGGKETCSTAAAHAEPTLVTAYSRGEWLSKRIHTTKVLASGSVPGGGKQRQVSTESATPSYIYTKLHS